MKLSVVFGEEEKSALLSIVDILEEQKQKICDCMDCSLLHGCEGCPMSNITDDLTDIIDRIETLVEGEGNRTE